MRMSQQDCQDTLVGFAKFFWFFLKLSFYTGGALALTLGLAGLLSGNRSLPMILCTVLGAAVVILFVVNMLRKQRFLLLWILVALIIPVAPVFQVAIILAGIALMILLYRGVLKKVTNPYGPSLTRGEQLVKSVMERYILILMDVFFIRSRMMRNPYFASLYRRKHHIW